MPENSVKIILEAADKTKEAFNSVKASSEGLLSSMKSHWLEFTAAAASIYTMIKGVQSFVAEAANAEQIESRMAFQIDAVGIKYKEVKIAIDAFANSVQNTTRFSSEMAQKGVGQMMQYTVDLGKAIEGTKIAMDMSTQTGMDLETTLRYVGMAMNGDIEVLGRMNPAFKHLADTLGEDATQSEKAEFGLKKLKELFGGSAAQDLTTYAGKVTHLGNTWSEFKKTIGEQLLPVLDTVLDRLTKMAKAGVITFGGGGEKERLEAQINTLEAELLALQVEQPYVSARAQEEVAARIVTAKKRIIEIDKQQADAEKKVGEASAEAVGRKNWDEFVQGLRKLNQGMAEAPVYVTQLQKTFNELGVTSEIDMVGMATAARTNMELIKKSFAEGKASSKDYQNALVAATEAMKKLVAPDITKSMADLEKKYQEGAKAISKDDPEFRKKIEALADSINEEMKKIRGPSTAELEADFREYNAKFNQQVEVLKSQLEAKPIKPKIDTSGMDDLKVTYDKVKGEIEANPIKVKVDTSGVSGATNALSDLRSEGGFPIESNFDFYGTGSSKKPLSEKIQEIIAQFGSLEGAIGNIESTIQIKEYATQMAAVQKKIDQLNEVWQSWNYLTKFGSADAKLGWHQSEQMDTWMEYMAQYKEELEILKLRQTEEELKSYGGYQTGTPYVPKTGLYMLHKGEEVRSTNQISMDTGRNTFIINGAQDPKATAREIEKVLKYNLHGGLGDMIKRLQR
jgi:hypothetical protein